MSTMTIAIIIFAITYLSLLIFSNYRAWIALGSAALFIALGIMPLGEVFSSVDWNVLMMIAGTMGTVALFIESRMPARLADLIINRVPNVKWAIISLSVFAAVISAFVDNVATVLMVRMEISSFIHGSSARICVCKRRISARLSAHFFHSVLMREAIFKSSPAPSAVS